MNSFWWGSCCLFFSFLCCLFCTIICLFVFLFLAIALSVYFLSRSLTLSLVSFVPSSLKYGPMGCQVLCSFIIKRYKNHSLPLGDCIPSQTMCGRHMSHTFSCCRSKVKGCIFNTYTVYSIPNWSIWYVCCYGHSS